MIQILSLGAGVQSSVVLLLSIRGVLPRLDHAIFADTQWEPKEVYSHLDWLKGEASATGIPLHTVTTGNLRQHATEGVPKKTKEGRHFISLPIFTLSADGSRGIVTQRQCTLDYKIKPIDRKIREIIGLRRGQHWPSGPTVNHWFGISADEAKRVRLPRRNAVRHYYPLVYDLGMTRQDCLEWAAKHYPGRVFPRSACIGCPYHNDDEWRRIKADPVAWADAVDADRRMRKEARDKRTSMGYLHRSCVPLEDVELRPTVQAKEQPRLFVNECMGMCGV